MKYVPLNCTSTNVYIFLKVKSQEKLLAKLSHLSRLVLKVIFLSDPRPFFLPLFSIFNQVQQVHRSYCFGVLILLVLVAAMVDIAGLGVAVYDVTVVVAVDLLVLGVAE